MSARKIAITGLLGALAIALSFLEGLLPPLPMLPPGARLGLSNVVTMFAAGSLGLPTALLLALLKGGFALLTRGVTAGLLSLCGGLCSTAVVWALFKYTRLSLILLGVCGALTHNFAQLAMARLLLSTPVIFYIPALLIFAVLTGLLTGLVLKIMLPALGKLRF